ncbi:glycosyltransferase family 1 protein [uncultured Megasphaera sp.]|uniref:glycosyltransferase family 1 protein n=1 Tax=uncultured Megasphaera sp. TaxID=165188 RepID=UPI0025E2ECAC|nr:glycosyltransferase family 1 protein [uncultured Megasphaera sp.]
MRIAILESIVMPAGHEVEFDRILVEELKKQGHEPVFFVPENFPFKIDYHCDVDYLDGGAAISYAGVSRLKRLWLSMQREKRRIAWLNSACKKGLDGKCDAIIVPTNSWRVMRSIRHSILKKSKVPFLFMFHGIMPKDRNRFCEGVKRLRDYQNVYLGALGLQTEFPELEDCPNFYTIMAPVYVPFDLSVTPEFHVHHPLRLGFFGQYRKEKNLDFFLQAFVKAKFTHPVTLTVQGATATQVDSDDFERLQNEYATYDNLRFLHKNLLGIEWQKEIMDIDVLLLPYGAKRYRYQPSAMLFTAIGYYKPVLQSPEMNPEVLQNFDIGVAVNLDSVESFSHQLEHFVNEFSERQEQYRQGLIEANIMYGQDKMIQKIMTIFFK